MAYDRKEYQKEYYKKNKDRISKYKKEHYDPKEEYQKEKKRYRTFSIKIDRPLAYKLENKLVKEGIGFTEFFRKAIEDYIK